MTRRGPKPKAPLVLPARRRREDRELPRREQMPAAANPDANTGPAQLERTSRSLGSEGKVDTLELVRLNGPERPGERPLWSYRIRGEGAQSPFVSRRLAAEEARLLRRMGIAAYGVHELEEAGS